MSTKNRTKASGPGRPAIEGKVIEIKLENELLNQLETYAAEHGLRRPDALRALLRAGLAAGEATEADKALAAAPTPVELVRAKVGELADRPGGWVSLRALRAATDMPRADLDALLLAELAERRLRLTSETNRRAISEDDHAAELTVAGVAHHWIALQPVDGRGLEGRVSTAILELGTSWTGNKLTYTATTRQAVRERLSDVPAVNVDKAVTAGIARGDFLVDGDIIRLSNDPTR